MSLSSFVFVLVATLPTPKQGGLELAGSRSPDGRYVIVYEEPMKGTANREAPKFWIIRRSDGKQMSPQLSPRFDERYAKSPHAWVQTAEGERQLMFNTIAIFAEPGAQRAANDRQKTEVSWKDDGSEVTIKGGKYLFSYTATYALRGGWFILLRDGPPTGVVPR